MLLDSLVPTSLTATVEQDQEGRLGWVTAANFPRFTRPAKTLLSSMAKERERGRPPVKERAYRDVTIYEFEGNRGSLSFVDGTLLASESAALVEKGVDRLREEQPAKAPLLELDAPREGTWDARGAFTGAALALIGVPAELASKARLGVRMEDADTATGYLVVDCSGEAECERAAHDLDQRLT